MYTGIITRRLLNHRFQSPGTRPDLFTLGVFSALALAAIIYVSLGLTPSSYGEVLNQIGAAEQGPILGVPRFIRMDEWELITPLFQAAVRNGFSEVNETSFYREDLRTVFPVPLRNWSLLFRPQLWVFFLTGAPTAFSIYFAFLIYATLTGYTLLFRELGADGWLAVAAFDETGLTGFYDIGYDLTPYLERGRTTYDDRAAALFPALREQLGLAFERTERPVERLIVDSVDKTPSEN
jgi:hypothetical protein